jgi:hypothetical protein
MIFTSASVKHFLFFIQSLPCGRHYERDLFSVSLIWNLIFPGFFALYKRLCFIKLYNNPIPASRTDSAPRGNRWFLKLENRLAT